MDPIVDKVTGCLLGLAVGDAIGTTVEFKPRGSFPEVTDMVGGGPFKLKPGQWTDDTTMALCMAESLCNTAPDFNATDIMSRFVNWYEYGYMSPTGKCFDIGMATRDALDRYMDNHDPYAGSRQSYSSGNGGIMRLAPVVIRYMTTIEEVTEYAIRSSKLTHASIECVAAAAHMANVLYWIMHMPNAASKDHVFDLPFYYEATTPAILSVIEGSFKHKTRDDIVGSGYVVNSLEAALWCFYHTDTFADCVLMAANLGDDADTTAAIAGQFAGAWYGKSAIPVHWLEKLYRAKDIEDYAIQLYNISKQPLVYKR